MIIISMIIEPEDCDPIDQGPQGLVRNDEDFELWVKEEWPHAKLVSELTYEVFDQRGNSLDTFLVGRAMDVFEPDRGELSALDRDAFEKLDLTQRIEVLHSFNGLAGARQIAHQALEATGDSYFGDLRDRLDEMYRDFADRIDSPYKRVITKEDTDRIMRGEITGFQLEKELVVPL